MSAREELVRRHGEDPIAYSTLQPGLRYFDASFGYIAYQRAWGIDLALGPPLCAPSDQQELAERFLRRRRAAFCYVQRDFAAQLSALPGPRLCGMGVDKIVDLHALAAAPPRALQGALRKARRAGLRVEETRFGQLGAAGRARLAAINAAYLQHSQVPTEMRFLNRPLALADDGLQRAYLLRQGPAGQVLGYAILNPWHRAGRVAGYLLDLLRFEPTRLWGVYYAAVALLAEQLRAEGFDELSLGFCPLHRATAHPPPGACPLLQAQIGVLERRLAQVQYLRRLRELKSALPGRECPRYFAAPSRLLLRPFCALISACGVSLRALFGPQLWRSLRAQ